MDSCTRGKWKLRARPATQTAARSFGRRHTLSRRTTRVCRDASRSLRTSCSVPPKAKRALRGELRVSRSFPFRRRPWSKVTGTASFSKIERLLAQARLGGATVIISVCPVKSAAFSGLSGLGAHMKKCSSERLRSESSESSASSGQSQEPKRNSQKPPLKVSVQTCQASQGRGPRIPGQKTCGKPVNKL